MIVGNFITDDKLNDVKIIYQQTYNYEFNLCSNFYEISYNTNYLYIVVYEENIPVATGRLNTNKFIVDKVTVIKAKRNLSYGDLVVRMLIDKAFRLYANEVIGLCFTNELKFYKKIGFNVLEKNFYLDGYKLEQLKVNQQHLTRGCCEEN